MKIFLSYRRKDSKFGLESLVKSLRYEYGVDSVIQDVTAFNIAGLNWKDAIRENVSVSNILILYIGPSWLQDKKNERNEEDQLIVEINLAKELDIPIFVVKVDDVDLSKITFPAGIEWIENIQCVSIGKENSVDLRAIYQPIFDYTGVAARTNQLAKPEIKSFFTAPIDILLKPKKSFSQILLATTRVPFELYTLSITIFFGSLLLFVAQDGQRGIGINYMEILSKAVRLLGGVFFISFILLLLIKLIFRRFFKKKTFFAYKIIIWIIFANLINQMCVIFLFWLFAGDFSAHDRFVKAIESNNYSSLAMNDKIAFGAVVFSSMFIMGWQLKGIVGSMIGVFKIPIFKLLLIVVSGSAIFFATNILLTIFLSPELFRINNENHKILNAPSTYGINASIPTEKNNKSGNDFVYKNGADKQTVAGGLELIPLLIQADGHIDINNGIVAISIQKLEVKNRQKHAINLTNIHFTLAGIDSKTGQQYWTDPVPYSNKILLTEVAGESQKTFTNIKLIAQLHNSMLSGGTRVTVWVDDSNGTSRPIGDGGTGILNW